MKMFLNCNIGEVCIQINCDLLSDLSDIPNTESNSL